MNKIYYIHCHCQAFDEQFMSYSTFCVHMGGNTIDSPRNIPRLIRLMKNRFGAVLIRTSRLPPNWQFIVTNRPYRRTHRTSPL